MRLPGKHFVNQANGETFLKTLKCFPVDLIALGYPPSLAHNYDSSNGETFQVRRCGFPEVEDVAEVLNPAR